MIRTLPLLALLSACAPFADADIVPRNVQTDASGYDLPQNCKAEPETVNVRVVYADPLVNKVLRARNANGYFWSNGVGREIVIDKTITGWKRADTLRHEQFHAYCEATRDACCKGHFTPATP